MLQVSASVTGTVITRTRSAEAVSPSASCLAVAHLYSAAF